MANAPTPQAAGQYYLLEKIAQGGMAEIYKGLAYDLAGIKKTVCIKKILPHISASQEFIDMLVDEAKIVVQLNHGNIAQIYDLGKVGDDYFMVMEFVEGQNLSKLNKRSLRQGKRIPIPLACFIMANVASGLNYMHRKTDDQGNPLHIIHRDISPQNIVVSYSGTVKIIDFGIAKAASKIGHTESGILKGKFAYMAPEQVRGDSMNHQSDIFSLGIILHELLTGKRLFKGIDNQETLRNVRRAKIPAPSTLVDDIPPALDAIVLKALTKELHHRTAHASDLHDDLMKFVYTQYPDFTPSQLGPFVQELFAPELKTKRGTGEGDSATPHLILDKTHSALRLTEEEGEVTAGGTHVPVNWREFMLELDWPDEPVGSDAELEISESSVDLTAKKTLWPHERFKTIFLFAAGVTCCAAIILWGVPQLKNNIATSTPAVSAPGVNTPATEAPEKAAPAEAQIVVESTPPGATIFWDDKETGAVTPATMGPFKPNESHQLGLFLEKYRFFKTAVTTLANEKQHFHIELAIDAGSLKILSTPPGAAIQINGEDVGRTPMTKNELPPDAILTVVLSLEGFEPWQQEVKIGAGKEQLLAPTLQKIKMKESEDHGEKK